MVHYDPTVKTQGFPWKVCSPHEKENEPKRISASRDGDKQEIAQNALVGKPKNV